VKNKIARLLVVDDEEHIRFAIAEALDREGYRVDTADSGISALESLARTRYDLMILDIRMPEVDGVQVMTQVHQQFPDLLIIILTGYASLESAITAVKSGAVDYLEKPTSTQEIVQTVKMHLQKHGTGRPGPAVPSPDAGLATVHDGVGDNALATPPLLLIYNERRVCLSENPTKTVQLTPVETDIMRCLMQNPTQLQTYAQIASKVWSQPIDTIEAQPLLRPHISRLRRKLRKIQPGQNIIQTVRTQGYRYGPLPLPDEPDTPSVFRRST
jgi:DNA-binding response OmpR family regulator